MLSFLASHLNPKSMSVAALTLFVSFASGGCGDEVAGPAELIFSTDYPGLYGEIVLEVQGEADLNLAADEGQLPTCGSPISIDPGPTLFSISSSHGFLWTFDLEAEADSCTHLHLDVSSTRNGMLFIGVYPPEVLPAIVELDGEPIGIIDAMGPYAEAELRRRAFGDLDPGASRQFLVEQAMEGYGFLLPGPPGKHDLAVVLPNGYRTEQKINLRQDVVGSQSFLFHLSEE